MLRGKRLYEWLKELREQSGLTQLQLGDLMSVTDKNISKWESARNVNLITEPYVKLMLLMINRKDIEWYDQKLNEYRILKQYEYRLKKEGK